MSTRLLITAAYRLGRAVTFACALLAGIGAVTAHAGVQAPWWRVSSTAAPTFLRPGDKEDVVFASASNLGDANAPGGKAKITISDKLPHGLTPTSRELVSSVDGQQGSCEPLPALRCSFSGDVQPYVRLGVRITVEVATDMTPGEVSNEVEVEGGEAPRATLSQPLTVAKRRRHLGCRTSNWRRKTKPADAKGKLARTRFSSPRLSTSIRRSNEAVEASTIGSGAAEEPAFQSAARPHRRPAGDAAVL